MSEEVTKEQLVGQIRFALQSMGEKNEYHRFEDLCRSFARERIAPNILPAVRVASGGDQGRDFETFRSHLLDRGRSGRDLGQGLCGRGRLAEVERRDQERQPRRPALPRRHRADRFPNRPGSTSSSTSRDACSLTRRVFPAPAWGTVISWSRSRAAAVASPTRSTSKALWLRSGVGSWGRGRRRRCQRRSTPWSQSSAEVRHRRSWDAARRSPGADSKGYSTFRMRRSRPSTSNATSSPGPIPTASRISCGITTSPFGPTRLVTKPVCRPCS